MSSAQKRNVAEEDQLDLIFHALSDQTRRRVLKMLASGPASITEISDPFDMSLPAVSKHVRVLERARLVERTIDGRVHRCSLDASPLKDIEQWLNGYRVFWGGALDSLADYIEGRSPARPRRLRR